MHLAIADLIVTFIMIPLEIAWRFTVQWVAGNAACKILLYLRAFGPYLSSSVLVCISLDRYFAILHPLKVNDAQRRGKIMLGLAWATSLLSSIPQKIIHGAIILCKGNGLSTLGVDLSFCWDKIHRIQNAYFNSNSPILDSYPLINSTLVNKLFYIRANLCILQRCSSPVTNRDSNFSPSMNSTPSITNAASVVVQSKKDRVPDLGTGPGRDSITSNEKLEKLLKNISNDQLQAEQYNTILSEDGNLAVNDKQAADLLDLHYQKISRLNFSVEDRNIKIRAIHIAHSCRSDTHRETSIFSVDFRVNELMAAIGDYCLNKSPGPNRIHGQMINHLGLSGRERFLDIINCSWNKKQLPWDWKKMSVVPIKKYCKTDRNPESY
ncbi:gonadotropin-releasing hormone II receptor [Trichonephila clavipes]|nr:gonadotropin-releasing hormone II receptor [Trichonephila clavipes]